MMWQPEAFQEELKVLIPVIRKAAAATRYIQKEGIRSSAKDDGSPVTQADIVSQAIILGGILRHFPDDAVAAEEESVNLSSEVRDSAARVLRQLSLHDHVLRLDELITSRGQTSSRRLWLVDPIDGTKGFKRGLTYAIAIGLCVDHQPKLGILAAPTFPNAAGGSVGSVIAFGGSGLGAYRWDEDQPEPIPVHVKRRRRLSEFRMVGSRAHSDSDVTSLFMKDSGISAFLPVDSQAKYLMVAFGQADLYLRIANPNYGVGYVWDHCAGQVILQQAGGRVTDLEGSELNYATSEFPRFGGTSGVLASSGACHEQLLQIVGRAFEEVRERQAEHAE